MDGQWPPEAGTPERPVYRVVAEDPRGRATKLHMVVVDEGWRESILCTGMYEWAAKWLVKQLHGKPFAPEGRP